MSATLHFFLVPVVGSADAEKELNRFLTSHRVVTVDREFIPDGCNSAWAICVTVASETVSETGGKTARKAIDYREVLPSAEFAVYAKLRALRGELAKQEGTPAYFVFTNEQMSEMVRHRMTSKAAIGSISGVGQARLSKYADKFLAILQAEIPKLGEPAEALPSMHKNITLWGRVEAAVGTTMPGTCVLPTGTETRRTTGTTTWASAVPEFKHRLRWAMPEQTRLLLQ